MHRISFIKDLWGELNRSFGKAMTTLQGWVGGILVSYFSPGSVSFTILALQVADLVTGTILALFISRVVKRINDGGSEEDEGFPELIAIIRSGKKRRFSWSEWGLWLEKLAVTFVLVIGCEVFKYWLSHDKPWILPGLEIVVGIIYFVLIFTSLRSVVRNTALVTKNNLLLWVWKWMGANADFKIKNYLDPNNQLLPEKLVKEIQQEPKSEPSPLRVEIVNADEFNHEEKKEVKNDAAPELI